MKYQLKKLYQLGVLALFLFFGIAFLSAKDSFAATRTWDGGGGPGDLNWSTCTNWVGDVCPIATDTVVFDGTFTGDSTLERSFGGKIAVININSGYTGTITVSGPLTVGTYNQSSAGSTFIPNVTFTGDEDYIFTGNFSQSNGDFYGSVTENYFRGNVTLSNAANFTTNRDIIFDGSGSSTFTCQDKPTYSIANVQMLKTGNEANVTIGDRCILPVGTDPVLQVGNNGGLNIYGELTGGGTLYVKGYRNGNFSNANLTLTCRTVLLPNCLSGFTGLDLASANSEAITGRTLTISGLNTTVDANDFSTFNLSLNNVMVTNSATFIAPTGLAAFPGDLTLINSAIYTPPSGSYTVNGILTVGITLNASAITSVGGLVINSGGVFQAPAGIINNAGDFTLNAGGTYTHNSGTMNFNASSSARFITCAGSPFNLVTINMQTQLTINSGCTVTVGNNPIVQLASTDYLLVNGTLSGSGVLFLKGYTGTATYRSPALTLSCGTPSCLSGFSGVDMKTNNNTWGSSHLTVSGVGTVFDASSYSVLDLDGGSFILASSATFTAPSGVMNIGEDINIASGTTFNHSSGTLNLTSASTKAAGITCTGSPFYLVTINKTSASVTVFAGCTVPVGNNPIVQVNHSSGLFINGTLSGSGILYLKGYGNGIAYYSPRFTISCGTSSCLSGFSGIDMETENNTLFSNAFTITGAGTSLDASTYSVLNTGSASFILSTSAAFTAPATNFRIGWNFTINTGTTFNHNNGIITFARSSGFQALNCGTVTLYDVVVAGSGRITLQTTDCTINDLTITSGTFSSPSDARILNVLGDLNHNAATNLGGGNLTINFSGTGNQYFNQTAGNIISHITVNKASGELILGNDISVTIGACTVIEGILYLNGHSYSCFAGLTIQEGGELKLQGTEVVSSPTLLSGSAVTFVGAVETLPDFYYILPDWDYSNTRINISPTEDRTFFLNTNESVAELFLYSGTLETTGATTFTPTDVWMEGGTWIPSGLSINVSNDFFCNSGTFSGSTGSLTVAGDLSIAGCNFTAVSGNTTVNGSITRSSGTFNHNNGTVVLGGTNQILDGTVTFYNLTKTVTSPDTLYFLSGSTNRILGALRLSGTDGNLLTLAPTTSSTQWYIDPEGTRDISYASVSYSTNVDSEILNVYGGNVADGGNNVFWLFVDDITGPTLSATNASASWFTSQRTAVVSVSDSEAGVVEVRYSWGTNGMDAGCTSGGTITSDGASLNAPIGGTTLYLCARDFVDNVSTWSGQYNWETTNPSVSASNASAVWFNTQRTAVVSATDSGGSGIAEVRYNWGSDPFDAGCTTGGTVTSHGASLNSPEGSTFLYLCTRDNAGLTATWNGEYKWEDNLPTGGSIFYVDGYYSVVMIDLTVDDGTDSDSGLDISTRTVMKSSATLVNGVCGTFDGPLVIIPTGTYPNFTDSANTSGNCYRYWYLITDNAGNQQTYSSSNTYMLDTETPTLSASNSSTSWFSTQRIAVVTSIDGVSGLVGTRYSWGTNDMDGTCMSGGTVTSDGSSLNAPSGGTILYLCNRDNAGNVSNWSGVYNWESDAPVLSASNNSSTWYNTQRGAVVSVSDAGGSGLVEARYSWGTNDMDGTCTTGGTITTNGISLNSPSGGTILYLCARDTAGNVTTWNGTYNWEDVVPTVSASNSSTSWFNTQRVAVVSASDTGGSGVAEIRYSWGTDDMNSFCNTGGTIVPNGGIINSPSGGTTLYLCVRDEAGNTNTWSGIYNWEDVFPTISASNSGVSWSNIQRVAVVSVSDAGGSGLVEARYSWGTNDMDGTCTSGGTITTNGASLNSPSGGTTLYLCARDTAGNVTTWNGTYNWEDVVPTITASNSNASWFNTQRVAVVSASDTGGSGLLEVRYSWQIDEMNLACTSGGIVTSNGSSLNAPTGGATLYLCTRDTAGNVTTWSGVYNWESDAPVLSASNNSSTWYNIQRVAVVSVSDAGGSGLVETRYSWGTNDMDVTCTTGGTITTNGANLNAPTGGTTLFLCARDTAGNVMTWNGVYNWETTAPSGGSITYSSGYVLTANIDINTNDGADPQSGINISSRVIERSEADLVGGVCGVFGSFVPVVPSGIYPNLSDTTIVNAKCYRYRYTVSDNAGNSVTYTSLAIIQVDFSFPSGGSINYTDGDYTDAIVNITLNDGTDIESEIDITSRRIERSAATLSNGVCGSFGAYSLITLSGVYPNITDNTVLTDTCYRYRYLVSDNAGNQRVYVSTNIVKVKIPVVIPPIISPIIPPEPIEEVDVTAPTGGLGINKYAAYTNNPEVTLYITVLDNVDSNNMIEIMISNEPDFNGRVYEEYVSFKTWNLLPGDGEKIVYLKIKDTTGNESEVYSAIIILDATNPILDDVLVQDNQIIADPLDELGGIEMVTFSINGQEICTIFSPNIYGEFVCDWTIPNNNGTYEVEATAYDLAGNYVVITKEFEKAGVSEVFSEIVEKVNDFFGGDVSEVGETLSEDPVVVTGNAVAGVVVSYVSLALSNIATVDIAAKVLSWIFSLLGYLGFRKKGKPYGYVFNSLTYEPISQAIIRIYDLQGDLVRTEVTDVYGAFSTFLESGKYYITVNKAKYNYPSKIIKSNSSRLENIYLGGTIEVKKDAEITVSIPIDPKNSRLNFILRSLVVNKLLEAFNIARTTVFVIGFILSLFAFMYSQSVINAVILAIYILSFIIILLTPKNKAKYGRVVDSGNNPKAGMEINLIEDEYQRLAARRVTDEDGIYRFVVEPKDYNLTSGSPDYSFQARSVRVSKAQKSSSGPMIIAEDLVVSGDS